MNCYKSIEKKLFINIDIKLIVHDKFYEFNVKEILFRKVLFENISRYEESLIKLWHGHIYDIISIFFFNHRKSHIFYKNTVYTYWIK